MLGISKSSQSHTRHWPALQQPWQESCAMTRTTSTGGRHAVRGVGSASKAYRLVLLRNRCSPITTLFEDRKHGCRYACMNPNSSREICSRWHSAIFLPLRGPGAMTPHGAGVDHRGEGARKEGLLRWKGAPGCAAGDALGPACQSVSCAELSALNGAVVDSTW